MSGCTCKGYWDNCPYCRSLEPKLVPAPVTAEGVAQEG